MLLTATDAGFWQWASEEEAIATSGVTLEIIHQGQRHRVFSSTRGSALWSLVEHLLSFIPAGG
jgi:hypothetical protein